jgi:excisionase family DNA binding protein
MDEKWKEYNPRINELISLSEAAVICGVTTNHLRLLISQDKLWARKIGNSWLTTKQALDDYLNSRSKPGPKKKNP